MAAPETDAEEGSETLDVSRLTRILAQVVAPVTVLTGLLFFFGWSRATALFGYFGLNPTVLGLSTTDYLLGAQDGLFVPVAVVALVGLAGSWCALVVPGPFRWLLARTWLPPVAIVVGLLLLANGLLGLFGRAVLDGVAVAPLCLIGGVLVLAFVVRGRVPRRTTAQRRARAVELVVLFVIVALGLFWATADYSAAVGRERARQIVEGLGTAPSVVLFSAQSLGIPADEVDLTVCTSVDPAYRVRYAGLVLLLQAGDQYVLLPQSWTHETGSAFLVPRSDAVRLDVRPADSVGELAGTC
ncbi:hypothetical protein FE697_001170 [Mumia zhuanghuii]|uniref:Uncharacterized protein n=2 Tax=Mumia TaxID=1546255 RepID=A0ABW1QJ35_9ACTN|nr:MULTISPECIES: hypothetical protein [Mumia]KAA1424570.1 hypothetical protein FE697_001170 [Mumia zhuanghuii]